MQEIALGTRFGSTNYLYALPQHELLVRSSAARIAAERLNENGYKTTPKTATSGSPFSVICFETEAEKACRGKPGAGADKLISMTHERRRQLPK